MTLPIESVLPELLESLRSGSNAVLVAPPGAGKTTAVAPALLGQPWCAGEIWLLSPRRLAARAAATRMAQLADEPVGRTIGYLTRLERRVSAHSRILVMTEGIFRHRIQQDPGLAGVSAVLFDEIHERSLDSDFGLALALDAQAGLRPDLRLLAMSATLDGARFADLMGGAPAIKSEGRAYSVDIVHVGRDSTRRIEEEVASACRRALREGEGSLLVFLPGVAEIERCFALLADRPANVDIHRLHGSLDPAAQQAALAPAPAGRRRILLATSIAETSLTVSGVRIVVDSGLARRPRYDRGSGLTRLVTERASQAAITQRAGRAGREAPGTVYRLWDESATASLPRFDPPEILEADLSALLLDCALWGVTDPRTLRWIDPPPEAAVAEARARLRELGAIGADHRPTAHGRAIAELPLPPRLAHMMVAAAERGWAQAAAEAALLVSENGLGGRDADLESRRDRWRADRGPRAGAARAMAERWVRMVSNDPGESAALGPCIALAYPDRLSKRLSGDGADWLSVGGRRFRLDPTSSLAREDWLAVAEVTGQAAGARILSGAPIAEDRVERLFADRIRTAAGLAFDPEAGGVRVERGRRLGAISLRGSGGGGDKMVDPAEVAQVLLDGARLHGLDRLPWPDSLRSLRRRAAFVRALGADLPDLSDSALIERADEWLPPLLEGRRRLGDVDPAALAGAVDALIGWSGRREIDRLAPSHFETPAGSRHPIDYEKVGGPSVMVRVQALFGLSEHPAIGGGKVKLLLELTSPAGRPIQTTRDLPGFWRGSWHAVAKEMRGRYPRHPWPEDPASASPTLRSKRSGR